MDATELAFAGIARQAELIAAGEVSSRELVELYLERIARLDGRLNAFRVVLGERALLEADQADARRRAGADSGAGRPLLGVPIAVKDNFDLAGEATGMGTNAYGEPAQKDAEIVRRMRAAGAVVIGKTNVPELCAVPWTESPTQGVTRNPWSLQHTPGGSSGGTAAAVAAGLVGAGLGSDGGGSIRAPSAYCGLFGLKTQRGRVPLAPHGDHWHGLSVSGVIARSVRDSALFYDAVADGAPDPGAPAVPPSSFLDAIGAREQSPDAPTPRPLRIASARRLAPSPLTRLQPDNEAALDDTAELLRGMGHRVEEHDISKDITAAAPAFTVRYLHGLRDDVRELPHPERLERRVARSARLGERLPQGALEWARSREAACSAQVSRVLSENDVLMMPVTPAPPPRIGACEGRGWLWTIAIAAATTPYMTLWNFTGQPACAVPAGFSADGLPRAVQLIGRANDEATLLSLAAQIESQRPWAEQRPPDFS